MPDRDYRWRDERRWDRDERSYRRPGGERDFYNRDELGEDDYGLGYGEEGMTNYRLRNPSGSGPGGYGARYSGYGYGGYGGGERDFPSGGTYGRGSYGGRYGEMSRDWGRGDRQRDLSSDFSSDQSYGYRSPSGRSERGRDLSQARRDWDEDRRWNRPEERDEERGWWDRASDEVSSWFGDEQAERRRRLDMRHQGRGPKGYRRSDERIREDVSDRLTDDPFIDATEIEIAVSNAEVTLTGTVDSRHARRRSEDITERVSGVTHVQNNLRVASGSETTAEERQTGSQKSSGLFSKT